MNLTRRAFLASTSALFLAPATFATGGEVPFDRNDVIALARDLASRPYAEREMVPQEWQDLTYQQYRSIRFRLDRALWFETETPFNIDFFTPGLYFPRTVQVRPSKTG